jgi:hypothetical protein
MKTCKEIMSEAKQDMKTFKGKFQKANLQTILG